MKTKTKDRLATTVAVALICSSSISLPGCATPQSTSSSSSSSYPLSITPFSRSTTCTTDSDCEMHANNGTVHREWNQNWTWKRVLGVAAGAIALGLLYDHLDSHGSDQRSTAIDKSIQPVNCTVNGCAK